MASNLDQAWQGFPNETHFKLGALEPRGYLLSQSTTQKNLPIQAVAYKSLIRVGLTCRHMSRNICSSILVSMLAGIRAFQANEEIAQARGHAGFEDLVQLVDDIVQIS